MKMLPDKTARMRLKKIAAALTLGLLVAVTVAGSANAMPRRGGDRDWDRHAVRAQHDWHRGRPGPGVVYAPPVVYSPPPVSPGINLILPLNFR